MIQGGSGGNPRSSDLVREGATVSQVLDAPGLYLSEMPTWCPAL